MANFLERRAQAKLESALANSLNRDERILQWDTGRMTTPAPGGKAHAAVTTRGLYVLGQAGTLRAGLCDIAALSYSSDYRMSVWTHRGQELTLDFGSGPRGVPSVLSERLRGLQPQRERVVVDDNGGGAVVSYHPWRIRAPSSWAVVVDDGVELTDEVGRVLRETRERIEESVLVAWSRPAPEGVPDPRDIAASAAHQAGDLSEATLGRADLVSPSGHGRSVALAVTSAAVHFADDLNVGPKGSASLPVSTIADWDVQYTDEDILLRLLVLDEAALDVADPDRALRFEENKLTIFGWTRQHDDATIREAIISAAAASGALNPMTRSANVMGRAPGSRT